MTYCTVNILDAWWYVLALSTMEDIRAENYQTTNFFKKQKPALESSCFQELVVVILFVYSILNEFFQVFSE